MSSDLDHDLLIQLYDVARHMRTCVDQRAQALGMTRAQMIIVARLERQPDISQKELAAAAEVAPMTIVRLIDRLEKMSLVRRCIDPDDRRAWRLRLTRSGADLARDQAGARQAARRNNPMYRTRDAMAEGLRKMKQNLGEPRLTKASTLRRSYAKDEA